MQTLDFNGGTQNGQFPQVKSRQGIYDKRLERITRAITPKIPKKGNPNNGPGKGRDKTKNGYQGWGGQNQWTGKGQKGNPQKGQAAGKGKGGKKKKPQLVFRSKEGTRCFKYQRGLCTIENCPHQHICAFCGAGHPLKDCDSYKSALAAWKGS